MEESQSKHTGNVRSKPLADIRKNAKVALAPLHPLNKKRGISPVFLNCMKKSKENIISPSPNQINHKPIEHSSHITLKQQSRAEQNRLRALEIRKQRLEKSTIISQSAFASNTAQHQGSQQPSRFRNPYSR